MRWRAVRVRPKPSSVPEPSNVRWICCALCWPTAWGPAGCGRWRPGPLRSGWSRSPTSACSPPAKWRLAVSADQPDAGGCHTEAGAGTADPPRRCDRGGQSRLCRQAAERCVAYPQRIRTSHAADGDHRGRAIQAGAVRSPIHRGQPFHKRDLRPSQQACADDAGAGLLPALAGTLQQQEDQRRHTAPLAGAGQTSAGAADHRDNRRPLDHRARQTPRPGAMGARRRIPGRIPGHQAVQQRAAGARYRRDDRRRRRSDSLFDIRVKRIHKYKRQLLHVMHIVHEYLCLVEDQGRVRARLSGDAGGTDHPCRGSERAESRPRAPRRREPAT